MVAKQQPQEPTRPQSSETKRFQCPHCERLLTCPHNVKQHIKEKHTFERPHRCGICEQVCKVASFTRPGTLNRHLRMVHNIDPVVPRGRAATKRNIAPSPTPVPATPTRLGAKGRAPAATRHRSAHANMKAPVSLAPPAQNITAHPHVLDPVMFSPDTTSKRFGVLEQYIETHGADDDLESIIDPDAEVMSFLSQFGDQYPLLSHAPRHGQN